MVIMTILCNLPVEHPVHTILNNSKPLACILITITRMLTNNSEMTSHMSTRNIPSKMAIL